MQKKFPCPLLPDSCPLFAHFSKQKWARKNGSTMRFFGSKAHFPTFFLNLVAIKKFIYRVIKNSPQNWAFNSGEGSLRCVVFCRVLSPQEGYILLAGYAEFSHFRRGVAMARGVLPRTITPRGIYPISGLCRVFSLPERGRNGAWCFAAYYHPSRVISY